MEDITDVSEAKDIGVAITLKSKPFTPEGNPQNSGQQNPKGKPKCLGSTT